MEENRTELPQNTELMESLRERGEQFPEADAAIRSFERANAAMEAFLETLRNSARDLEWMRGDAAAKVRDWSANLIPGTRAAKELADWLVSTLGGSLGQVARYAPTSFAEMRGRLVALAATEKAAMELRMTDLLGTNQRAVDDARATLARTIGGMNLERQIALATLQEKILGLSDNASK